MKNRTFPIGTGKFKCVEPYSENGVELVKGKTYQRPAYISEGGGYFISFGNITDVDAATREYYDRFPDQHIIARNIVVLILLGFTVLNAVIGLSQLQREKKFIKDTEIMRTGRMGGN